MKMKWKYVILYSLTMLLFILYIPISSSGANEQTIKVDLVTTPTNVLFNVQNMKPGDVIKRTLSIENNSNVNVDYQTKAKFKAGSKKLYEQLRLHVTDGQNRLYDGKLSEFTGFDSRKLTQSNADQFVFFVEFPYESGNEFQGLATQFEIVVSAASGIIPNGDADSSKHALQLPKTGNVNPILFVFAGLFMLVIGIAVYFRRQSLIK